MQREDELGTVAAAVNMPRHDGKNRHDDDDSASMELEAESDSSDDGSVDLGGLIRSTMSAIRTERTEGEAAVKRGQEAARQAEEAAALEEAAAQEEAARSEPAAPKIALIDAARKEDELFDKMLNKLEALKSRAEEKAAEGEKDESGNEETKKEQETNDQSAEAGDKTSKHERRRSSKKPSKLRQAVNRTLRRKSNKKKSSESVNQTETMVGDEEQPQVEVADDTSLQEERRKEERDNRKSRRKSRKDRRSSSKDISEEKSSRRWRRRSSRDDNSKSKIRNVVDAALSLSLRNDEGEEESSKGRSQKSHSKNKDEEGSEHLDRSHRHHRSGRRRSSSKHKSKLRNVVLSLSLRGGDKSQESELDKDIERSRATSGGGADESGRSANEEDSEHLEKSHRHHRSSRRRSSSKHKSKLRNVVLSLSLRAGDKVDESESGRDLDHGRETNGGKETIDKSSWRRRRLSAKRPSCKSGKSKFRSAVDLALSLSSRSERGDNVVKQDMEAAPDDGEGKEREDSSSRSLSEHKSQVSLCDDHDDTDDNPRTKRSSSTLRNRHEGRASAGARRRSSHHRPSFQDSEAAARGRRRRRSKFISETYKDDSNGEPSASEDATEASNNDNKLHRHNRRRSSHRRRKEESHDVPQSPSTTRTFMGAVKRAVNVDRVFSKKKPPTLVEEDPASPVAADNQADDGEEFASGAEANLTRGKSQAEIEAESAERARNQRRLVNLFRKNNAAINAAGALNKSSDVKSVASTSDGSMAFRASTVITVTPNVDRASIKAAERLRHGPTTKDLVLERLNDKMEKVHDRLEVLGEKTGISTVVETVNDGVKGMASNVVTTAAKTTGLSVPPRIQKRLEGSKDPDDRSPQFSKHVGNTVEEISNEVDRGIGLLDRVQRGKGEQMVAKLGDRAFFYDD